METWTSPRENQSLDQLQSLQAGADVSLFVKPTQQYKFYENFLWNHKHLYTAQNPSEIQRTQCK